MGFTIDGIPAYDPKKLHQECLRVGLPIDPWFRKANSYYCPLTKPGRGALLLLLGDLNNLNVQSFDKLRTLEMSDSAGNYVKMPAMVFTGKMDCLSPGAPDDPNSLYMVEFADRRWLQYDRGVPINKAYNLRTDVDGSYVSTTLNSGQPWTWQQVLNDIWPATYLNTAPTLPFTPDGTPESIWITQEIRYPLNAVEYFLNRLSCGLFYDPAADNFTIYRMGQFVASAAQTVNTASAALLHSFRSRQTRTGLMPEKVRIEFRVKPPYTDGTLPYYTIDKSVTSPSPAPVAKGTMLLLEDDLVALWDGITVGSFTNATLLASRATERFNHWLDKRQNFDTDVMNTYSGLLWGLPKLLMGNNYKAVVFRDWGDGIKTELSSGSIKDRLLEDWYRIETQDELYNICPIEDPNVITSININGSGQIGLQSTGGTTPNLSLAPPVAAEAFVGAATWFS